MFQCRRIYSSNSNSCFSVRSFCESGESRNFQAFVEELFSTPLRYIRAPSRVARYYFEDNFRYVYANVAVYQKSVEHHHVGSSVIDYVRKTQIFPPGHIKNALENGFIRINKKKVEPDYKLCFKDVCQAVCHQHENPTLAVKPKLIFCADDICAVDKPPTIPIHPPFKIGGFNHLISILSHDYGIKVGPLFRIDSPTSGLVLLSSKKDFSRKFHLEMDKKRVEKTYLAEVNGNFPSGETIVDVPLISMDKNSVVLVDKVFGKPARTIFRKVVSKPYSSLLECEIESGRSHQIRVHLQYLGYPIVNDYLYASEKIFGPKLGKDASYEYYDAMKVHQEVREHFMTNDSDDIDELNKVLDHYSDKNWKEFVESHPYRPELDNKFEDCPACQNPRVKPAFKRVLHLHSLRYASKEMELDLSSNLPFWWHTDHV